MFEVGTSLTFNNANALLAAGSRALEQGEAQFDLGALTAVDSAAVATLLGWQRKALSLGKTLLLSNPPANLTSLISLYDMAELVVVATSTSARTDLPHH